MSETTVKKTFRRTGANAWRRVVVALLLTLLFTNCRGDDGLPLLSFLSNNRLLVVLKGTYASDNPLGFEQVNNNQLFRDPSETLDLTGLPSYSKLPIFIDIGEVRLSTKAFLQDLHIIQSTDDSEEFWNILSTERQVYCNTLYGLGFENNTCLRTGGMINFVELMNGRGVVYPSRDVGPGTYLHAGLFIRALVTGHSRSEDGELFTNFDNNRIYNATNVMHLMNFDPGQESLKQSLTPQLFPLHHKVVWGQQTHMHIDESATKAVVELRFNLKENLMVHSFLNSAYQNQTVVATSDWRRPHSGEPNIGGNLLMRTKIFYPDFTLNAEISGGTSSNLHYYAVYVENECYGPGANGIEKLCDLNDQLPLAATPVRNGVNTLKELPAGYYRLQCRYDSVRDGVPEQVLGETLFQVGMGPGPAVQVACACGHSTSVGCN